MNKFKNAYNGLRFAFKDKSVLIQLGLGLLAIIGGFIIKLNYYEWLIYIICIVLVIALELVNSVVEMLCNAYSDRYDLRIKMIKDMSSGAVLIVCIGAFIVCLMSVIRRIG